MRVSPRPTNKAGRDLIKSFEALSLVAYLCPASVWTIGYGHTKGVKARLIITEEQAESFLSDDLYDAECAVCNLVSVPLTDNQFAALVSFVFNCGAGNFRGSTMLRKLNEGDFKAVPGEFAKWNKANGKVLAGLTRRRAAEAALFIK